MLLFCIGMDPIVRWMCERILHRHDMLRGYADDLGFSLRQCAYSLPRLGRAFKIVEDVTGLTLKLRKCALVPHGESDVKKARTMLSIIPAWAACPVVLAARYLGAFLGPHASKLVWEAPLAKCRRAAIQIRQLGLGYPRASILFNARATACLAFVAQLFIPDGSVCAAYHLCTQLLTAAPCFALPGTLLCHLTACGFGNDIKDLSILAIASKFRVGVLSSKLLTIIPLCRQH